MTDNTDGGLTDSNTSVETWSRGVLIQLSAAIRMVIDENLEKEYTMAK